MLSRTLLVVLALVLAASAKPSRTKPVEDYSYDGMFSSPFFRVPTFDDSTADESVGDSEEIVPPFPSHPVGSFSALGSMLDGIFNRMRQQFERFPTPTFPNLRVPSTPNFAFGFGLPSEPKNATSTSTIVGDSVVTVNETVYHKNDGGIKSVFRIKVVDIQPHKEYIDKMFSKPSSEKPTDIEEVIEVELPAEKDTAVEKDAPAVTTPEEQVVTESAEELDNEIPSQVGPEAV